MMPLVSYAQTFELSETEIYRRGSISDHIEIPVEIKNTTNQPQAIVIQRIENNIGNDQSSSICWGEDCTENNSLEKNIPGNTTINLIRANFEAGLSGGYSSVKYLIYNKKNPGDSRELIIHYTIDERLTDNIIYNSRAIKITEVYPNPVSDHLYVNYSISDDQITAKIQLHNVLGSVVNEYQLEPLERKAKINTMNLNSGVYFYSLSVNNETVFIKKFLVRK